MANYTNKQKLLSILVSYVLILFFSTFESIAEADTGEPFNGSCPYKTAVNVDGQQVYLWQHVFEDGTADLVMAIDEPSRSFQFKRITFGGDRSTGCHFPILSLIPGGRWGWHVAWVSSEHGNAFYIRVDGDAWVSSPPRKITSIQTDFVELTDKVDRIFLKYRSSSSPDETKIKQSLDEGKTWEDVSSESTSTQ